MLVCILSNHVDGFFSDSELIINTISAIFGGLALTVILFFINEYLLPRPNIIGEWNTVIKINKATVDAYINLRKEGKIHLLQKGLEITGSGEWIKEKNRQGGEINYEPEKRVRLEIEGSIERNYLKKSKVYLQIIEAGRKRETSATYILKIENSSTLSGTFISTAANASGDTILKRNND